MFLLDFKQNFRILLDQAFFKQKAQVLSFRDKNVLYVKTIQKAHFNYLPIQWSKYQTQIYDALFT